MFAALGFGGGRPPTTIYDLALTMIDSNYTGGTIPTGFPSDKERASRMEKFNKILTQFGTMSDTMIARGGDLAHDIGKNMNLNTFLNKTAGNSMIDYITSITNVGIGQKLQSYTSNVDRISTDLNNMALTRYVARCIKLDKSELNGLTKELTDIGFSTIVLDSQFGNIFTKGFGQGMALRYTCVSELDGATKVKGASAIGDTILSEDYTMPFTVPCFYSTKPNACTNHIIQQTAPTSKTVKNTVKATIDDTNQFTLSCSSGISVNAICELIGLEPPRGSGESSKPITFQSALSVNDTTANHVALIKTITDWAQLVYVFYLNYVEGIRTILITNDSFCLALAAALQLPVIIRTPSTKSEVLELWICNDTIFKISDSEKQLIIDMASKGISPENTAILLTKYDETISSILGKIPGNTPPTIIQAMGQDFSTLRSALSGYCEALRPQTINRNDPNIDAIIKQYRYLLRVDALGYIKEKWTQGLQKICIKYDYFGVQLETLRKSIKENPSPKDPSSIVVKQAQDNYVLNEMYSLIMSEFDGNKQIVLDFFSNMDFIKLYKSSLQGTKDLWAITVYNFLKEKGIEGNIAEIDKRKDYWNAQNGIKKILKPVQAFYEELPVPAAGGGGGGGGSSMTQFFSMFTGGGGGGSQNGAAYNEPQKGGAYLPETAKSKLQAALNIYGTPVKDTYKPSVSATLSSAVANLSPTDSFDVHSAKILAVLEAMQTDAYETNLEKEFWLRRTDIEDMIEATKQGVLSPQDLADYVGYYVFVDNDMATITPYILDPETELPTFVKAIQHFASYGSAAGIPANIRRRRHEEFLRYRAAHPVVEQTNSARQANYTPYPTGEVQQVSPEYVYVGGKRSTRKKNQKRRHVQTRRKTAYRRRRTIRRRQ